MSRVGELYLQSAARATLPFRRLYFDTEPLTNGGWPLVSGQFTFCLDMATTMGAEICVPAAALHERSEQYIRETLAAFDAVRAKAKEAQKDVQSLGLTATLRLPTEDELRGRYADVERAAVARFRVQQVPYASRSLDEIFRMAVARDLTFEEKKGGVVGLQDCVILLSALEHVKANRVPSAFVSNDGIFSKISMLAPTGAGTDVQLVRGLTALELILKEAVDATFNADFSRLWDETTGRIKQALTARGTEIQRFLEQNIDPAQAEALFVGRLVSLGPLAIDGFGAIRPDLAGEANDPVRFSCDLSVSYSGTVEEQRFSLDQLIGGRTVGELSPPEKVVRDRSAIVELGAQIDADYTNLKLLSARIRA
jgi:hypothetical protein